MSAIHAIRHSQPASQAHTDPVVEDIPDDLRCPITYDLMVEPVRIYDTTGHGYEKEAIEKWFKRCQESGQRPRSPLTGEVLTSLALTAADDLKDQIDKRSAPSLPAGQDSDAPSAPPLPAGWDSGAPSDAAHNLPLHAVEQPTPSAPPLGGGMYTQQVPSMPVDLRATTLPSAPPLRPRLRAVGATAKDFANVSALGRRDLTTALKKHGTPWLSTATAATLGATGGLLIGGAAAAGLAAGTLLVPCAGVAAGLAVVGLGATAGSWLRQRLTSKAQRAEHVADKLTALTEMRSAFEALPRRNQAENAALAHVNRALSEFDARKSLQHHLTWAAGAALIAAPVGVAGALFAYAKSQESDKARTARSSRPAPSTSRPAPQRHTHIHYHAPLFPDASCGLQAFWTAQEWASLRPTAAPPTAPHERVGVAMQPRWLEALDPRSYARLCASQGARA